MTYPQRISFFEAQSLIDEAAGKLRLQTERVPLSRALNRIAQEELAAAIPLPHFDNAAMDGFAMRAEDINSYGSMGFELIGEQYAGALTRISLGQGQCSRITTGAMLPEGCDAVAIKEECSVDGTKVKINDGVKLKMGANIRKVAEDVLVGEVVTKRGQVLKAARLSLMAALGQHDVLCSKRPTVAIFTTGDELQSPGQALQPGQIYDSNRVLLQSLLLAEGLEPVAWPVLPDDPDRIAAALKDAAFSFDVVITCGGVSAGEKDYLPAFLEEHGQIHFWKVRMKPGMPILFGQVGNSVLSSFLSLGRRLLDGLQGRAEPRELLRVQLSQNVSKKHSRLEFMRGDLHINHQGVIEVTANPATGSHRLKAAAESNALILLPEGLADYTAGTMVKVLPYGRWLS
jgi:molybdopterin molybdotransferase